MKFAYAQRSYLGDPDFVVNMTSTLDRIMSKEFAYQVRRNISDVRYSCSYLKRQWETNRFVVGYAPARVLWRRIRD